MLLEVALVLDLLASHTDARTEREQTCLIENVAYEAAGEPLEGRFAIIEVTMARVKSKHHPDTICGVVYADKQFSWTNAHTRELTERELVEAAQVVFTYLYHGETHYLPKGTLHYINPAEATDLSWYKPESVVKVIGKHHFLKI